MFHLHSHLPIAPIDFMPYRKQYPPLTKDIQLPGKGNFIDNSTPVADIKRVEPSPVY